MIYRFDGFELDPAESRLSRDGRLVEAQPKVLEALGYFLERPGRLISKEELVAALWPGVHVGDESLTQLVRKLRVALDDDSKTPRFVQTVLKRGYRFVAAVEAVSPDRPRPPAPRRLVSAPAGRRLAAILAIAAAGVGLGLYAARDRAKQERGTGSALAGWREVRLTTTPARESYPALAPSGQRYAFVRPTEPDGEFDLFVADLAGAESRLTATPASEFAPQFSPDERWVLYSRRDAIGPSVWRVAALGGAPERLLDDGEWATWSPDGLRVAYVRRDPGRRSSVRLRRLADGAEESLWTTAVPLEALVWSPDGSKLAAVAVDRILVGEARAGAVPRPIGPSFEYVRSLAWQPDGASLVTDGRWSGSGGNLVRLPLDGGPPQPLTRGSAGLFHPSVSRDGSHLLYAAEHKVRQIWRFDALLAAVTALPLPTGIECLDVAPDGERLAVSDWLAASGETLALLDLAGGGRRPLGAGLCPAFSPSGEQIAFLGHRAGEMGLWLLDLASGARRRVTEDRGAVGLAERNSARRPAFSPDGTRVAFEGAAAAESGIFVVELATGQRRLLAPELAGNLAWSPDGRWLALSGAGDASGFALIDVLRGGARRAFEGTSFRASPVWLDARRVAFLIDQQARPAQVVVDAETLVAEPPAAIGRPPDASFWGVYELLPDRRDGWIGIVERYESDLHLLIRESR